MTFPRTFSLILLILPCPALASLAGCGWGGTPITADPTISPPAGIYPSAIAVTLTDATPGASVYYTTDGTTPSATSTHYTNPIPVTAAMNLVTVRAVAMTGGYAPSAVISATYDINPAAEPTFDPSAGTYISSVTVSILDTTPNASIFYTTDGTTPTTASTAYIGPITLTANTTIQAVAIAPTYSLGPIASATYTILPPQVAAPTFTPPPGNYASPQTISLGDATPNSTIFYTTDGTTPTTASTPYVRPFPIASTGTVQAIATAPNLRQSPVAIAFYTIGDPTNGKEMWTWMGGSSVAGQQPDYGTLGVPSYSNTPGGNYAGLAFPGPNGSFILLDGQIDGAGDKSNGLWQYDPAVSQWNLLAGGTPGGGSPFGVYGTQGVASTANQPPTRVDSATWSGASGDLYFFGGYVPVFLDPPAHNDLWRFNISTLAFTWLDGSDELNPSGSFGTLGVASPTNVPGALSGIASCSDHQGNLWMFGGITPVTTFPGSNASIYNDLWQFNPATGDWTWYTGSSNPQQTGNYGTQGVPSPSNSPSARSNASCWTDPNGKLWLFGGDYGNLASASSYGVFNDLWMFDPATLEWTWVGGANRILNVPGVYGTLHQPSAANMPGGRAQYAHWIDKSGDLWLFGGNADAFRQSIPNDLWRYNVASGEWTWMSGEQAGPGIPSPVYGTLGVPAPANTPGGRLGAVNWVDSNGNLWLYGGYGADSTGTAGYLSDLWRYQP